MAKRRDALLAAQTLQHDADLLLSRVLLARRAPNGAHHPPSKSLSGGGLPGGQADNFGLIGTDSGHVRGWPGAFVRCLTSKDLVRRYKG